MGKAVEMALRQAVRSFARVRTASPLACLSTRVPHRVTAPVSSRTFATSDDSHDDFKSQSKVQPPANVQERIQQDIDADDVVLYMKGVPTAPQCGFSNAVVQVLDAHGVQFAAYNVLEDPELRQGIKEFSDWPTVPQVYVKGEFVGGCDILINMYKDGELSELLVESGVKEA